MKALSMKRRGLRPEWFWAIRWWFLVLIGVTLMGIPAFVAWGFFNFYGSDAKDGLLIGVSCGLVGAYGLNILVELIFYAFRRIRLGRKAREFWGGKNAG